MKTAIMASGARPAGNLPQDEELIACVRRREEPALGMIYGRYNRLIYAIALRITGDRAAAEEVVQDVFQAVWQSAGSFQTGGNVAAWLVGIARHRAIDVTRSRGYRSRAREEAFDDTCSVRGAVDSYADALLLRESLRLALGHLPQAQREPIELAYYAGLTQIEIAARLGAPVGTVKARMRMGLAKLRVLLGPTEE